MSWETVIRRDRGLTGATVGITRGGNVWRLVVYLRRDVVAAMGWRAGLLVMAAYGRGGDGGYLRLSPLAADGPAAERGFKLCETGNRKTTLTVRTPLDRGVAGGQQPARRVVWRAAEGSLLLRLPDFARPRGGGAG